MKDLKLNAAGDLDLASGDAVIIDDLAQAITVRLKWALGEWAVNTDYGFPYFEDVLGMKFDEQLITQDILDVFNTIPEIKTVEELSVKKHGRKIIVAFTVAGDNGTETGEAEL